jgi:hypothetical protein
VAIPPLSPQPPDFFDYNCARILPPLFKITYPDGLAQRLHPTRTAKKMVSSWYCDPSHPFYFDMLCQDSKPHRFQIKLKPDLSSASLHHINTSELFPSYYGYTFFHGYRICEDTLVSFCLWQSESNGYAYYRGLYTGLMSATSSSVISQYGPASKILLPEIRFRYDITLCPASGRLVRLDVSNSVTVLDFF